MQERRGAIWALVHGSLTAPGAGRPLSASFPLEALTFAWVHLHRSVVQLLEAAHLTGCLSSDWLSEALAFAHVALSAVSTWFHACNIASHRLTFMACLCKQCG